MNPITRLVLYAVLISCALVFGWCFYSNYNQFMEQQVSMADVDPLEVKLPAHEPQPEANGHLSRIWLFGGAFFATVLGLGLLVGHDFSHFVAHRAGKILFDDDGEPIRDSEYEQAEQAWADGNPLEAVQLMRDYLKKNLHKQHVAIRIAEIYEKDLNNPLAAALEYEEILKQRLPREQWGWTAIHLCNVYSTRLNQPDKAIALLKRIDTEYGDTSAAEKARKRLEMFGENVSTEVVVAEEPEPPPSEESPQTQSPVNTSFQAHLDKFLKNKLPDND